MCCQKQRLALLVRGLAENGQRRQELVVNVGKTSELL
jgi:hypothetical protein